MATECPHLPTTGAVYRVLVSRVGTRQDEPVADALVCADCYRVISAIVPPRVRSRAEAPPPTPARIDPPPQTDGRAGHPPPWYLTAHAVERFMHTLRDVGSRLPREPGEAFDFAEAKLRDLAATARYRETRGHLELWRSPPASFGLRWLVSTARRPEGPLPQVVWVGQSRPPERMGWT